eukprot:m.1255292 g.1255292  ORF g.1255292 m.1255292 type:complete len:1254 (+) comp24709_c0_seq51:226-3987(+)
MSKRIIRPPKQFIAVSASVDNQIRRFSSQDDYALEEATKSKRQMGKIEKRFLRKLSETVPALQKHKASSIVHRFEELFPDVKVLASEIRKRKPMAQPPVHVPQKKVGTATVREEQSLYVPNSSSEACQQSNMPQDSSKMAYVPRSHQFERQSGILRSPGYPTSSRPRGNSDDRRSVVPQMPGQNNPPGGRIPHKPPKSGTKTKKGRAVGWSQSEITHLKAVTKDFEEEIKHDGLYRFWVKNWSTYFPTRSRYSVYAQHRLLIRMKDRRMNAKQDRNGDVSRNHRAAATPSIGKAPPVSNPTTQSSNTTGTASTGNAFQPCKNTSQIEHNRAEPTKQALSAAAAPVSKPPPIGDVSSPNENAKSASASSASFAVASSTSSEDTLRNASMPPTTEISGLSSSLTSEAVHRPATVTKIEFMRRKVVLDSSWRDSAHRQLHGAQSMVVTPHEEHGGQSSMVANVPGAPPRILSTPTNDPFNTNSSITTSTVVRKPKGYVDPSADASPSPMSTIDPLSAEEKLIAEATVDPSILNQSLNINQSTSARLEESVNTSTSFIDSAAHTIPEAWQKCTSNTIVQGKTQAVIDHSSKVPSRNGTVAGDIARAQEPSPQGEHGHAHEHTTTGKHPQEPKVAAAAPVAHPPASTGKESAVRAPSEEHRERVSSSPHTKETALKSFPPSTHTKDYRTSVDCATGAATHDSPRRNETGGTNITPVTAAASVQMMQHHAQKDLLSNQESCSLPQSDGSHAHVSNNARTLYAPSQTGLPTVATRAVDTGRRGAASGDTTIGPQVASSAPGPFAPVDTRSWDPTAAVRTHRSAPLSRPPASVPTSASRDTDADGCTGAPSSRPPHAGSTGEDPTEGIILAAALRRAAEQDRQTSPSAQAASDLCGFGRHVVLTTPTIERIAGDHDQRSDPGSETPVLSGDTMEAAMTTIMEALCDHGLPLASHPHEFACVPARFVQVVGAALRHSNKQVAGSKGRRILSTICTSRRRSLLQAMRSDDTRLHIDITVLVQPGDSTATDEQANDASTSDGTPLNSTSRRHWTSYLVTPHLKKIEICDTSAWTFDKQALAAIGALWPQCTTVEIVGVAPVRGDAAMHCVKQTLLAMERWMLRPPPHSRMRTDPDNNRHVYPDECTWDLEVLSDLRSTNYKKFATFLTKLMSARPFRISGATPDASSKKIPPTVLLDLPTDTELRTWIHQYIAKRKLKPSSIDSILDAVYTRFQSIQSTKDIVVKAFIAEYFWNQMQHSTAPQP